MQILGGRHGEQDRVTKHGFHHRERFPRGLGERGLLLPQQPFACTVKEDGAEHPCPGWREQMLRSLQHGELPSEMTAGKETHFNAFQGAGKNKKRHL